MFKYLIETLTEEAILRHCRTIQLNPSASGDSVTSSNNEVHTEKNTASGDMSGIKNVQLLIHSLFQIILDIPLRYVGFILAIYDQLT